MKKFLKIVRFPQTRRAKMLDALRLKAQQEGALWIAQILRCHGVDTLRGLPDSAIHEALGLSEVAGLSRRSGLFTAAKPAAA